MRMLKYLVLNLVFPLIEPEEQCFWDYAVAACVTILSQLLVSYLQLRSLDIIVILTGMRMWSLVMNCIPLHGFIWKQDTSYEIVGATYCHVPSHVMKLWVPHLATYCYVPSHVLPPANDLLIVVRPYIFVHLGCICIEYIWKYGPHLISSFGSSHPWVHMRSFSLVPWSSTW